MDWNADGKNDILAGDTDGNVWIFLNVGSRKNPKLAEGKRVEAGGKPIQGEQRIYKEVNGRRRLDHKIPASHKLADVYSKPHMADWDGDGLKDLLVGYPGHIAFFKNSGTKNEPSFLDPVKLEVSEGKFSGQPGPYVTDWDGDGLQDLLVGSASIYLYRNIGTAQNPILAQKEELPLNGPGFKDGDRMRIEITDWNNDGKKDILVGNYYFERNNTGHQVGGNIWLFLGK